MKGPPLLLLPTLICLWHKVLFRSWFGRFSAALLDMSSLFMSNGIGIFSLLHEVVDAGGLNILFVGVESFDRCGA